LGLNHDFSHLKGQTALITGGARRIGKACAECLASYGVSIVLHYNTSQTEALELKEVLLKTGAPAVWLIQKELSSETAAQNLISEALTLVPSLEILINSASVFPVDDFKTFNSKSLLENMEVNAWTPLFLGREFLKHSGAQNILNFLDTHIHSYDKSHFSYHLSKRSFADINGILALEGAPRVRVNAIAPGLILPPPGASADYMEKMKIINPLQSIGNTEEINKTMVFLLSASFITGQIIYVDGGKHLDHTYGSR
jgi:NAD(P)-dependent dehydrogenase (short-subunit alcohol dehydrogenase family)